MAHTMRRREFIGSTLATVATAVTAGHTLTGVAAAADPAVAETPVPAAGKQVIQGYRPLGRTGIRMSDISFGAGKLPAGSMILRAIDRGINYFDTAPDYGRSEEYIGDALKKFRRRESIHIASKFCLAEPYPGHLPAGSSVEAYVASVEGSLQRMGTEYLDAVFVHAIGEKGTLEEERNRLLDPNMLTAFDRLKRDGKVRFLAVSSHGPQNLEPLLEAAIESGHYAWIMTAFNFMKFPRVPQILQQAARKEVGVIAMKTLAGARESGVDPQAVPFEHAAFRWVLRHREISGLVVTMQNATDLDRYVQASGTPFSAQDQQALDQYVALHGGDYCRTGCGECEPACGQGVPVASILRYQMYFEHYRDEKRAMLDYRHLSTNAASCLACGDGEACAQACPYGLPVAQKLRRAHEQLTFA